MLLPRVGGGREGVGGAQRRGEGLPRRLLFILAAGFLIRAALIPSGAFGYDVGAMREWTRQLVSAPLAQFYAADLSVPPDHLPGDLWLLWLLGQGARLIAPGTDFSSDWYMAALKLVAIAADLLIGVLLFAIVRGLTDVRRALLITAAFLLNPAVIFLSAVWGQWDAVSMAVTLAALLLLLRGWIAWALPALAVAVLIKPQLVLLAPLFVIYAVRSARLASGGTAPVRSWWTGFTRTLPAVIGGGVASIVVTVAICLPFDVGLPLMPTRWSIIERVEFAADRYPLTTYNAYNLWALPIVAGDAPLDSAAVIRGLSAAQVGLALLLIAYAGAVVGAVLIANRDVALIWASLLTMLAMFLLPTRVHERYLFPALVFAVLACGLVPRLKWAAIGLTLTAFSNLYLVYAFWQPAIYPAFLHTSTTVRLIALLNLAILVFIALLGLVLALPASARLRPLSMAGGLVGLAIDRSAHRESLDRTARRR